MLIGEESMEIFESSNDSSSVVRCCSVEPCATPLKVLYIREEHFVSICGEVKEGQCSGVSPW